ncbi:MAG: hypothetical protein ACUVQ0_06365 [Thermoproteota archaeon]
MKMEGEGEKKDVEEFREVLKIIREEIPGMLKEIVEPLKEILGTSMTEEQARERAKAIATFYKELTSAGMKEDVAIELIKNQFINPTELLKNMIIMRMRRTPSEKMEEEAKN